MTFCTKCGRPKSEAARFCTGCGTPFPDVETAVDPGWDIPQLGLDILSSGQSGQGRAVPEMERTARETAGGNRKSRRSLRLVVIVVIAVALAGGGTAAAMVLSGGHGRPTAAPLDKRTASSPASTPTSTPTLSSPVATPASSTATSSPGPGQVGVAPGVAAGDPQTPQVVALLDSYFGAINSHDYQGYVALLTPEKQQGVTPAQFQQGFGTTKDSSETLQGISAGNDGDTVATVTFISHQNAADSANGESCTNWRISLYMEPNGSGYLIGTAPPGYHASYGAC